ncbi:CYTH domain-containing protein [Streptomyces sp. TRM68367]|uniref:CYTH domain-containing protein n=1 Tax=Streptomyces sp. TRM68367 TaxID=2758415 RepID=UPI00165B6E42|nr:CYTH domain-containing protein [Streptomyces sp. TRM68367]MBC9724963.1 CYTH domain-containing protein [Streptomyces sp. TRM68367]
MPVEIEMRARFDAEAHDQLVARLEQDGTDLGCDDKHIYFYVLPDQLLKVTDNTAAGTAKITLKHSKIGQGVAFPETEFAIAREDVTAAVRVFNALGFEPQMHQAFNRRHNYRFRGVEIAVKWSEAWGHHAEFEVLLDDNASDAARQEATDRIFAVAKELGVRLMTEQELADFTAAFEADEQARKAAPAEIEPQT